jgi:hypothetical protein
MCYRAYLQQGLAFAFAFAFVQQSVLEGGSPHTMVRSERAAGGAELDGSSATTSTAVGGGGDRRIAP